MKRVEDFADILFKNSITKNMDEGRQEARDNFIKKVTSDPIPYYYDLLQIVLNYTGGCYYDKAESHAKPLHKVIMTIAQEGDLNDEQSKEVTRQLKLYVGAIAKKPMHIIELTKDIAKREHEEFKMEKTLPQAYRSLKIPDIDGLERELNTAFLNVKSKPLETENDKLEELRIQLAELLDSKPNINPDSADIMLYSVGLEDWQIQPTAFLEMNTLEQDKVMKQSIYGAFISKMQAAYTKAYDGHKQQRSTSIALGTLLDDGFGGNAIEEPTKKKMAKILKTYKYDFENAVKTLLGIQNLTTQALNAKASDVADREVEDLRASLKLIRLSKDKRVVAKTEAARIAPTLGTRRGEVAISAPKPIVIPPLDLRPIEKAQTTQSVATPPSIEPPTKAPGLTTRQGPSIPPDLILKQLGVSMDHIMQEMSGDEENMFLTFSASLALFFPPIKKSTENEEGKLRMLQEVEVLSKDNQVLYNAGISEIGISSDKILPSTFLNLRPHEQDDVLKTGILKEYIKMNAAKKQGDSASADVSMFNSPPTTEGKPPNPTISFPDDGRSNDFSA